jgi:ComF family protein
MKEPFIPELPRWKRVANRVLDLLYPSSCALCRKSLKDGRALCGECEEDLPRLTAPFCQSCGEMFQGEIELPFACPNCQHLKFAFEFARPAMLRDERTLDLIHRLKYGREIYLAGELGSLASHAFVDPRLVPAVTGAWPLVPVPLHRKRLRHRHFNQAEEIARALSAHTGLPLLKALKRNRQTETQTLLSRKQRMENLRGAFSITRSGHRWINRASVDGVVLLDDVLTTGSTVHECAATLRRAGFHKVFVVTVMRG